MNVKFHEKLLQTKSRELLTVQVDWILSGRQLERRVVPYSAADSSTLLLITASRLECRKSLKEEPRPFPWIVPFQDHGSPHFTFGSCSPYYMTTGARNKQCFNKELNLLLKGIKKIDNEEFNKNTEHKLKERHYKFPPAFKPHLFCPLLLAILSTRAFNVLMLLLNSMQWHTTVRNLVHSLWMSWATDSLTIFQVSRHHSMRGASARRAGGVIVAWEGRHSSEELALCPCQYTWFCPCQGTFFGWWFHCRLYWVSPVHSWSVLPLSSWAVPLSTVLTMANQVLLVNRNKFEHCTWWPWALAVCSMFLVNVEKKLSRVSLVLHCMDNNSSQQGDTGLNWSVVLCMARELCGKTIYGCPSGHSKCSLWCGGMLSQFSLERQV